MVKKATAAAPKPAPPVQATSGVETPRKRFERLARDEFRKDDNIGAAAKRLYAMVVADQDLFNAIAQPLILTACDEMVRGQVSRMRRAITSSAMSSHRTGSAMIKAIIGGEQNLLLDRFMPGGKRLRDAGREELAAARDEYARLVVSNDRERKFYELIMQGVPHGKRVGEVYTEQRVREVMEQAMGPAPKTEDGDAA